MTCPSTRWHQFPACITIVLLMGSMCVGNLLADDPTTILNTYCMDCHDANSQEGGVNLDVTSINWNRREDRAVWERVYRANHEQLMPPPGESQPTVEQRESLAAWLDAKLLKHTPIGGTLPRRLNQAEYEATIQDLLHLPDYKLPPGFPKDTEYHGFDTWAKASSCRRLTSKPTPDSHATSPTRSFRQQSRLLGTRPGTPVPMTWC